MLEQGAAAAIQCPDRRQLRHFDVEHDAEVRQYLARNDFERIERRAGEPQKSDLQRDTEAVQRTTMGPNHLQLGLGRREETLDLRAADRKSTRLNSSH